MTTQFKIRTDAEYVQALRQLYQYAETQGAMEFAEGGKLFNAWTADKERIERMFDVHERFDAAGRTEHARGGPELIGMTEVERNVEWSRTRAGKIEATLAKFDESDPFEMTLAKFYREHSTEELTRGELVNMLTPPGTGDSTRMLTAINRLIKKGALKTFRQGNQNYVELVI